MAVLDDRLSEYEAAMLLPQTPQVMMLHQYAMEYQRDHGGADLEGALHTAQLIRQRWEHDLPRVGQDGFRPFVGTREATRCCVLTESLQRKLVILRDRAYRWAQAKLHQDGVRLDLPTSFEAAAQTEPASPQPAPQAVVPAEKQAEKQAEPATTTAMPEGELATKRDIKEALKDLYADGLSGAELEAFRKRGLAGNVSLDQMQRWVDNLLQGQPAA